MKSSRLLLLLGALSPLAGHAADVRTIQPASHSLFPPQAGSAPAKSARDAGALKPGNPEVPSPILVHYGASIGPDGLIAYGCESENVRDFRKAAARDRVPEDRQ